MSKQTRGEESDENVWYEELVGNKSKLKKKSEPKKDVTRKKYFVEQKGPLQLKNGFYVSRFGGKVPFVPVRTSERMNTFVGNLTVFY